MTVCYMCNNLKIRQGIYLKRDSLGEFNFNQGYDLCEKCNNKLMKFIEFEKARSKNENEN